MRMSIDNGAHYYGPSEAAAALEACAEIGIGFDVVASYMDAGTRERVAWELAPCSEAEFLRRYLQIAPCDLVIG